MIDLTWVEGRAFAQYQQWEDYQANFYKKCSCKDHSRTQASVDMLADPEKFLVACKLVLKEWPITCHVHLTNHQLNHKAWIGHAAGFLSHNACEDCTIAAWHRLNREQQEIANRVADFAVKEWLGRCANESYQKQKPQLELTF